MRRRRRSTGKLFTGGCADGSRAHYAARALTGLDWIIIAFTVLLAVWGYGQGLIAGGLALAGFAAGAFIGSRLGPLLLQDGSHSPYAPLFALIGALLLGSLAALLVGFVPPSQFASGNPAAYFLIVGGGALGLGLLVPFIFYKLRKPSWKQPEPEVTAS